MRVAELPEGTPVEIAVMTVRGANPGPILYLGAAFHGDPQGNLAALMAHALYDQWMRHAHYMIDVRTPTTGGRVDGAEVERCLRGVLPGRAESFGLQRVIRTMHVVRAARGGLLHLRVGLNDAAAAGQVVAAIVNLFGKRWRRSARRSPRTALQRGRRCRAAFARVSRSECFEIGHDGSPQRPIKPREEESFHQRPRDLPLLGLVIRSRIAKRVV